MSTYSKPGIRFSSRNINHLHAFNGWEFRGNFGLRYFWVTRLKNNPRASEAKDSPCPSCNHPKCHRHGRYSRKAARPSSEIIWVQRFLCRPCGTTHSVLPAGLLPICRWWLDDILDIAKRLAQGETAYAIAKSLGESLAVLVHLKRWIAKACAIVVVLAREMGLMDAEPPRPVAKHPGEALALVRRFSNWRSFTHAFSHAFHPARFPLRRSHTILTR